MEKEKPKNTDIHNFINRIDRILGLGMIAFAIIFTVMGAFWFTSVEEAIPFSYMAFTGLMFFVGILLVVSDWLENHLNIIDEIEAFPHVMSYHLNEWRKGRTTRAMYMWLATLVLILFTSYLIFKYDKWTHPLFAGISAVVMGLIIGGILAYSFIGTNWFQARDHKTPSWWFIVPAIAIVIASVGGIYFTEPVGVRPNGLWMHGGANIITPAPAVTTPRSGHSGRRGLPVAVLVRALS